MRKVLVFNNASIDGFIADVNSDMSWAHSQDEEWNDYINNNARGGDSVFVFGRVTYEMMASFWPTPEAIQMMPDVANTMNAMQKVVFSRTLDSASWNNTKVVKNDPAQEIRKMKGEEGPNMVIFGSGTIVSQLAQENLIDIYQLVVHPIVLGKGKSMFATLDHKLPLKQTNTRTFGNGNVVITYSAIE